MSLYTSLRLALSTMNRVRAKTPQPVEQVFDFLLTQAEDFIITQDNLNIIVPHVLLYYDLLTQDDLTITTQDDKIIEAVS